MRIAAGQRCPGPCPNREVCRILALGGPQVSTPMCAGPLQGRGIGTAPSRPARFHAKLRPRTELPRARSESGAAWDNVIPPLWPNCRIAFGATFGSRRIAIGCRENSSAHDPYRRSAATPRPPLLLKLAISVRRQSEPLRARSESGPARDNVIPPLWPNCRTPFGEPVGSPWIAIGCRERRRRTILTVATLRRPRPLPLLKLAIAARRRIESPRARSGSGPARDGAAPPLCPNCRTGFGATFGSLRI